MREGHSTPITGPQHSLADPLQTRSRDTITYRLSIIARTTVERAGGIDRIRLGLVQHDLEDLTLWADLEENTYTSRFGKLCERKPVACTSCMLGGSNP